MYLITSDIRIPYDLVEQKVELEEFSLGIQDSYKSTKTLNKIKFEKKLNQI